MASAATASQPMAVATVISTGRMITPKTPVTAAAATRLHGELAVMPESSWSAVMRARELIAQATAMRTRSEERSLASMASVSAVGGERGVTRAG